MSIALGRKIKTGLAVGLPCLVVLLVFRSMWQDDTADRLVLAKKQLQQGHPEKALELLHPLLQRDPADGDVCYLAAESYSRKKDYTSAVVEYGRVPVDHERRAAACFRAGDILLLQLFQPTKAEQFLREALASDGDLHAAKAHLAALYGLCGLTSLTSELRVKRVRAGQATEVDLVLLGLGDTAAENNAALASYQKAAPDDALTQLAAAHQAWQQHDFLTAQPLYEKGIGQRPDLCDAQARLGRILKETGDDAGFLKWHAGLPKACDEHADIWAVRGDYSLSHHDVRGAIRCYWEAARRDPAHRSAHHQLGQALASLGETQIAEAFQRRNEHLQQLLLAAKQFNVEASPEKVVRVALAAQECGHVWEAWTWAEMLRKRFPQGAESLKNMSRPSSGSPRVQETAQPAVQQAREAARRTQCKNNMKQIGLALHNYESTSTCFPLGSNASWDRIPNWRLQIFPYLEQANLYSRMDFNLSFSGLVTNANTTALSNNKIATYICPSSPLDPNADSSVGTT